MELPPPGHIAFASRKVKMAIMVKFLIKKSCAKSLYICDKIR